MRCIYSVQANRKFSHRPMVKPLDQGWGSCPVNGRDWGTSESCDPAIIEELIRRFDQCRVEAGRKHQKQPVV